jgi:Putative Flp pilus-assembly TadE/G-like
MRGISGFLHRSCDDARGTISILGAFVLVGVVGVSALALEYGHALLQKSEDQRVADLAAYGGALVYNSSGSSSTDATSAASNIAALNGLSSGVSPSVVTSPSGDGNKAVEVTVTTSVPLMLARVLTTNTTLPVSATSYAEIDANAPACIVALSSGGTGISLSGGATLSAPGCTVASNSTITAHACANKITTKIADYDAGTPPTCSLAYPGGSGTVTTNKTATADPLSGNTEVATAKARFNSPFPPTAAPSAPTVTSTGGTVTYNSSSKSGTLPSACSTSSTRTPWTISCTGGQLGNVTLGGGVAVTINLSGTGPFTFGTISVGGGSSFALNNTTSGGTYNFAGTVSTGSGSNGLTFSLGSNSTYNMAAGVTAQGSAPIAFTAGTFNIGTTTCSGAPSPSTGYSICVSGSGQITFAGPSTFDLAGGIYQDASGMPSTPALSLGYGSTTNSFNIGQSTTTDYSLYEANGATLFGDATGSTDLFQMAGNLTTTGGTCVAISAAAEHDINGYIAGAGGLYLGSGIYTVNGYVALGNSSGGNVSNCPTSGTTTGLNATGVTLVISGTSTVTCGSTTSAFCLGAGYGACPPNECVVLTAPTSSSSLGSSTANLAVIGPQSSSDTGAATFTSGATDTQISGAFYFPNGQIYMSGGATLHDTIDSGSCLELIGTQVTLTAGSALGSTCTGLGSGSSGTTVSLVQ